jgi:hypothetical protein
MGMTSHQPKSLYVIPNKNEMRQQCLTEMEVSSTEIKFRMSLQLKLQFFHNISRHYVYPTSIVIRFKALLLNSMLV